MGPGGDIRISQAPRRATGRLERGYHLRTARCFRTPDVLSALALQRAWVRDGRHPRDEDWHPLLLLPHRISSRLFSCFRSSSIQCIAEGKDIVRLVVGLYGACVVCCGNSSCPRVFACLVQNKAHVQRPPNTPPFALFIPTLANRFSSSAPLPSCRLVYFLT